MAFDPDALWRAAKHATPADNAALLALLNQAPMQAGLSLVSARDPDFFALHALERGVHDVYCYEDDAFACMGSFGVRDAWIGGRVAPLGYLSDLRTRGRSARHQAMIPTMYARALSAISAKTGCQHYWTAILQDNSIATNSLTQRRQKRKRDLPVYQLITPYEMVSLPLFVPRGLLRFAPVRGYTTALASPADVDEIGDFLASDAKTRLGGYRFDVDEFAYRLTAWPGFKLEDTVLVRQHGQLVGTATAYDPSPVKRYCVARYGTGMRGLRALGAACHAVFAAASLPQIGEPFVTRYLVNVAIANNDPHVLRHLLAEHYALAFAAKAHLLALGLFGDERHHPALRGLPQQRTPFGLYSVHPSDVEAPVWPSAPPGFEIALA